MIEVSYRQAQEADLRAIASLYEKLDAYFRSLTYRFPPVEQVGTLWVESFRRTLGRFSIVFVAETPGGIAGFALGRVKRVAPYLGGMLVGELSDIWVEPDVRRSGAGQRLAELTFDWLRSQGVHSIEVQILEGNLASDAFFRHLGFIPELRQYRQATPLDRSEDA